MSVKIYYICSIQRSGTHLISNIIQKSYDKSVYKNCCCKPPTCIYKGFTYLFTNKNTNHKMIDENIKNYKNYKCIIFSRENVNIYDDLKYKKDFENELDKIFENYQIYYIQNIRDPRNIIASSLEIKWKKEQINNSLETLNNFFKISFLSHENSHECCYLPYFLHLHLCFKMPLFFPLLHIDGLHHLPAQINLLFLLLEAFCIRFITIANHATIPKLGLAPD